MAKLTKKQEHIVEMYVRYFGTVATEEQIKSFDGVKSLSKITADIRKDADNSKTGLTPTEFLNDVFQNLFGRDANPKDLKYVKTIENNKNLPIATIIKNGSRDDKAVYNTKKLVAQMVAAEGRSYELDNINQDNYLSIYNAKKGLLVSTVDDLEAKISNVPDIINGKTDMLDTGVDTFTGTAKNDMFLATSSSTQWTVADSIDGGKGVDTLKLIDNAAITLALPVAATVKNVEILDLISGGAVTADSTTFDGVTDLYTTSKTSAAGVNTKVTAAATTNINVNSTNGDAAGAETVVVDGGKDVTVVSKNNVADTITVGGTTAAAGKVSVTSTGTAAGSATAQGNIAVTGGTEITVNQYAGNAVNTTNTGGTITVTGNEKTTTVTVNQSATAVAAATVVGYTAGAVTVNDKNTASTTLADTIETVTVKNAGVVTIDSGALKTLNLEGKITSVTANDVTVKTGITAVDTLALNLKDVTTTAVTADADVKTLNIASSKDASTVTTLTSAGATAINVSGDAALTVTNLGAGAANQVITVTNTAGVTIGNALATDVKFTGGAGADSVVLANGFTKAITMGAGNDTVKITALPTVGTIDGGAGDDKLISDGISTALSAEPRITGFEILRVENAASTTTTHNAFTLKALELAGNANAANSTTFTNVAAGVGLTVLTAQTATTVNLFDVSGTADVFNLTLSNATAATQAAGTVTIAGVETINITTVDAGTAANTAATADSIVLFAADATSIVVSGNNGLTFTAAGSSFAKVTNFDASAVVGNDTITIDTPANLAVTFASANVTVGAAVSIKGGAGNDTLTGTAQANDTIIGGAGNDTINYNGGIDTLTGGAGNDIFVIGTVASVNANTKSIHATITDLAKGDSINLSAVGNIADMTAAQMLAAKVSVASGATFDQALNASITGAANDVKWFQFENNTYLVVDGAAGGTEFVNGADSVIKITGLVDLSNSTINTATTGAEILVIA